MKKECKLSTCRAGLGINVKILFPKILSSLFYSSNNKGNYTENSADIKDYSKISSQIETDNMEKKSSEDITHKNSKWWPYLGAWCRRNRVKISNQDYSHCKFTKRHYQFENSGIIYFATCWIPRTNPIAMLMISHHYKGSMNGENVIFGFGPFMPIMSIYVDGYDDIANFFCDKGLIVFGHDHFGHGRTNGKFETLQHIMQFVDPLIFHVKKLKEVLSLENIPVYAFGYSLGALFILQSLQREKQLFDGIILCNPFMKYAKEGPITRALARYCCSSCFCCGTSTRLADILIQGGNNSISNSPLITQPILIFQGMKDRIIQTQYSLLLFEKCSSMDKTYRAKHNSCHGLNCLLKETDLHEIWIWIAARINKDIT